MKAFEDLTSSCTEEERRAWEAEAKTADQSRDHDVAAMDIYDVHEKPGKWSQAYR